MKLELKGIGLSYRTGHPTLRDIDLQIAAGERIVFLGASGSGKTSLLKVIAGLVSPSEGLVLIDGRDCARTPPHERGVAMAFQTPALFPHKTVASNLAQSTARGREASERLDSLAKRLGISRLMERYPETLSGGERARVGLGRALASGRTIVLLDEPFSGLDSPLRIALRDMLMELQLEQNFTCLFVTHDPDDAAIIGDRIVLLENGQILQSGSPESVTSEPQSWSAALLTSRKPWNRVDARITSEGGTIRAMAIDEPTLTFLGGETWHTSWLGKSVIWALHPDDTALADQNSESNDGKIRIKGQFVRFEGAGIDRMCVIKSGEHAFRGRGRSGTSGLEKGSSVIIEGASSRVFWFLASSGGRIRPSEPCWE